MDNSRKEAGPVASCDAESGHAVNEKVAPRVMAELSSYRSTTELLESIHRNRTHHHHVLVVRRKTTSISVYSGVQNSQSAIWIASNPMPTIFFEILFLSCHISLFDAAGAVTKAGEEDSMARSLKRSPYDTIDGRPDGF